MDIVKKVIDLIGKQLPNVLMKSMECVLVVFGFLKIKEENKQKKEENKELQKKMDKIEEVVNTGSLQDLINLANSVVIMTVFLFCGCKNNELVIQTTRQWEGHYYTVREFKERTNDIELNKKESIWVMSNDTLKQILKEKQK